MYYKKVSEFVSTKNHDGDLVIRRYSVVKSEINIFYGSENVEVPSYGIEISEQVFVNNSCTKETSEMCANISPYQEKVKEIAKYLMELDLSPIHLYDIIDDNYQNYICDYDEYAKDCKIAI